ncbi:N-6 DNA methylase [Schumannella sp. 10F1B-5-1]|uniref:N-6 DNA methylase n=1 Tax=Schumannella sp. 10F1B-5-1 TaxID=2590780 RepID=UPI002105CD2B|nr:N-6 DNA methylase [Schumannella sp. 10F1B-5-1]
MVTEQLKRALRDARRAAAMSSPGFEAMASASAAAIRKIAEAGANEATISQEFDARVKELMLELEFDYVPSKEERAATTRRKHSGRIDSRVGSVVIEFKQVAAFNSESQKKIAVDQLIGYMESLPSSGDGEIVGLATDGVEAVVVVRQNGITTAGATSPLTGKSLRDLAGWLVKSEQVALTASNLIGALHGDDGTLVLVACRLFDELHKRRSQRAHMLFLEWQRLFKLSHDDVSQQATIEARRSELETIIGTKFAKGDREVEYSALFALQTAIAIAVKLLAHKVLVDLRGGALPVEFARIADDDDLALGLRMRRLENGAGFREQGFTNILEGDFFAWYAHESQWTDDVATAVRRLIATLSDFEGSVLSASGRRPVSDLFRDLYEAVVPGAVRRSLGEFYTPPWLADHTVERAIAAAGIDSDSRDWRGIDPCCGSGTFLTVMLARVLGEDADGRSALRRVVGVDLNPLAVLMARVNYFINVSPFLEHDDEVEIPVYLGDATQLPVAVDVGSVRCLRYQLNTERGTTEVVLPHSIIANKQDFSLAMFHVEAATVDLDPAQIVKIISDIADHNDLTPEVRSHLDDFAGMLVDLQRHEWDGVWARILANFFATAELGSFDIVVGNPPWIDWKTLPEGYRAELVSTVGKELFSGDVVTGGISLNVCAVIASAAARHWLAADGALAFLMPEPIMYQHSYEGFRKIVHGDRQLFWQELIDWSGAGHPFHPVTQRFAAYVISSNPVDYAKGIPIVRPTLREPRNARRVHAAIRSGRVFAEVADRFSFEGYVAFTPDADRNFFAVAENLEQVNKMRKVSGFSNYRGREGVEFYPQELMLLTHIPGRGRKVRGRAVETFVNYNSPRSKHRVPQQERVLETAHLRPLLKGVDIERFHMRKASYYVPFAYSSTHASGRSPLPIKALRDSSPALLEYFQENRQVFESQTQYNARIMGAHNTEFYSLARVGEYSHVERYVAFRDNSSWQAVVVEAVDLPWGGRAMPIPQNHAVSIAEGPNGSITGDEAHFICAVMNSPIVRSFMLASSDHRTFPVRLRVRIPGFDAADADHVRLAEVSRSAHLVWDDVAEMSVIDSELDELVSRIF